MNASLLRVQNLWKSYGGVHAVQDVSFELGAGELLAMIGPNGAGKSTCFNVLNGQIAADHGRISINGREAARLSPRQIWKRGVGRTFQVAATFASMSVRENVQVGLLSHCGRALRPIGRADAAMRAEADDLLSSVGMTTEADRPCGELAYGDLKRLELALALSNAPALLLMDEPTAGMAAPERADLMALTARIARERRIGVLFTEHDMDVVFEHADRVIVLDRGRLIAEGRPEAVRRDPAVLAAYLGGGMLSAAGGAA